MDLILLGPPGSGKGTQGVKIAERLGALHLSTGDMLRQEISSQSELGLAVQGIMARGELVSDGIVLDIVRGRLAGNPNIVFDGYPRNRSQAEALEKLLHDEGRAAPTALLLEVPEEIIRERLLRRAEASGRTDDSAETIMRRLDVYSRETVPLIEFFEKRDRLTRVNGVGTLDEVEERLAKAISGLM